MIRPVLGLPNVLLRERRVERPRDLAGSDGMESHNTREGTLAEMIYILAGR